MSRQNINELIRSSAFKPSSYSAVKSATTTVSGQSEAVAFDATKLKVSNIDSTNYGLVAFGESAAAAETNAANGVVILPGESEIIGVPQNTTHYAWLGDTGTVELGITQGT